MALITWVNGTPAFNPLTDVLSFSSSLADAQYLVRESGAGLRGRVESLVQFDLPLKKPW